MEEEDQDVGKRNDEQGLRAGLSKDEYLAAGSVIIKAHLLGHHSRDPPVPWPGASS